MELKDIILEKLKAYGVGRRKLNDDLFAEDQPPRLGIYDAENEAFCHNVIQTSCHIPGCNFTADSILEFETHYNSSHRYSCAECKKVLPSPHLLDLHVQEKHDSFFAVMATRKPSYCCYIEECKDKFNNVEERLDHCVQIHKLPKDFRFDQKPKLPRKRKVKKKNESVAAMECDSTSLKTSTNKFAFSNSKLKTFSRHTGKSDKDTSAEVNMECFVEELRESLPHM